MKFLPHHSQRELSAEEERRLEETRQLLSMIREIGVRTARLNETDKEFMNQLRTRIERFGDQTIISRAQLFWLRDIKDKLL